MSRNFLISTDPRSFVQNEQIHKILDGKNKEENKKENKNKNNNDLLKSIG